MEKAVELMSFEADLRSEFTDSRRRLLFKAAFGIVVG